MPVSPAAFLIAFTAAVEDRQQFSSEQVLAGFIDEIREKGVVLTDTAACKLVQDVREELVQAPDDDLGCFDIVKYVLR